jgi:hypothetical protein
MGESYAGITVPDGEPGALHDLADTLSGLAGGLGTLETEQRLLPGGIEWAGPASVSYYSLCVTNSAAIGDGREAISTAIAAITSYADLLHDAKGRARQAIDDAHKAQDQIDHAKQNLVTAQVMYATASGDHQSAESTIAAHSLTGTAPAGAYAARDSAASSMRTAQGMQSDAEGEISRATGRLEDAQHDGHRAMKDAKDAVDAFVKAMAGAGSWVARVPQLGAPAQGSVGTRGLPAPVVDMGATRHDTTQAVTALVQAAGYVSDMATGNEKRRVLFKEKGVLKEDHIIDPKLLPAKARNALPWLEAAGDVARVMGPVLTVAGGVMTYIGDKQAGDSTGKAARKAGVTTALGAGGGVLGSFTCGVVAGGTAGIGAATCPVLISGGAIAGTLFGDKIVNPVIDWIFS